MYKSPLTANVVHGFISSYQSLKNLSSRRSTEPFVYVDSQGVKLVTNMVGASATPGGVFALSMAEDGWMEMLALND